MRPLHTLLFLAIACKGTPTPDPEPACDGTPGYSDRDGDGFGDANRFTTDCVEFVVENADDCDDGNFSVNPEANEICDGLDNDCNGLTDADDDGLDIALQYPDADEDGWGEGDGVIACDTLEGHVLDGGDCDGADPEIRPDALEVCDTLDNDCDGFVDADDESLDSLLVFFADSDLDGFGAGSPIPACEQPPGTTQLDGDCDDLDPATYPGALEICDDADQNCDGDPDSDPFAPDPCTPWEAPYTGSITVTLTDGTETFTCAGTAEVTLDRTQDPDLQGTFACTLGATANGWELEQTGTITGLFREDGTVEGSIQAFEGEPYDWEGAIAADVLSAQGDGLFLTGGVYDLNVAFQLDFVDVPP